MGTIALSEIAPKSEYKVTLRSGNTSKVPAKELLFDRLNNAIIWQKTLTPTVPSAGIKMFSEEVASLFTGIVHAMKEHAVTEETTILHEGKSADRIIVLEEGKVAVEGTKTTLVAGSFFGFCSPQYTSNGSEGRVFANSFVAEAGTKYLELRISDLDRVLLDHGKAKLLGLTGAVIDPSQMLVVAKGSSTFENTTKKRKRKKARSSLSMFLGKNRQNGTTKLAQEMTEVKSELNSVKEQVNEMQCNMEIEMATLKTTMAEILGAIKQSGQQVTPEN